MKILNWLKSEFYVIVALMLFTSMLANDSFLPAMQIIADDLGASISTVNLSFSLVIFGAFLPQIPIGIISDKIGRRPFILIGGVIFFIATFILSHATNIETFLACRFFQGFGAAFIAGPSRAMVTEHYEYEKRVFAMAIMAQLSLLAPMMGPLIGTYMLMFSNNDWHYIYIYNNIIFIVLFVIAIFVVPETLKKRKTENTDQQKPTEPEQKETIKDIIKIKSYRYVVMAMVWRIAANLAWVSGSAKIMMIDMHATKQEYGYLQIMIFGGLILGNLFAGKVSRSFLPSKYMKRHLMISSPIILILFVISMFSYNVWTITTLMACILFAGGSIMPVNQSIVVTEVKSKGLGLALMMSAMTMVNVFAAAVPPFLYDVDSRIIIAILISSISVSVIFAVLALPHIRKIEKHL